MRGCIACSSTSASPRRRASVVGPRTCGCCRSTDRPRPTGCSPIADRDVLERGFRRLPPDQRAILALHHYLGYAPSEIAETLGIPAGTARSRLAQRPSRHARRARRGRAGRRRRRPFGMTHERDIERLLDLWFAEGPTQAARPRHRRGRRTGSAVTDSDPRWRLLPWRDFHMNTTSKIATTLAAVLVVGVVGYNLLPRSSNGIGGPPPAPTPTTSASSAPTTAPSPSGSAATDCVDAQGCPSAFPAGPVTSTVFTPKVSFTAPAGYIPSSDEPQAFGVRTAAGSTPGGVRHRRATPRHPPRPTPARVTSTRPSRSTPSTPSARHSPPTRRSRSRRRPRSTIGPYSGKTFDIELAPTWTGTCPWSNGKPGALALTVQSRARLRRARHTGWLPATPRPGSTCSMSRGRPHLDSQTDKSAAAGVLTRPPDAEFTP